MSNARFPARDLQPLQRSLFFRVDASDVGTSAGSAGLDEGSTDATIVAGTGSSSNEFTIAFNRAFARVPVVQVSPLAPIDASVKSVSASQVVIETSRVYRVGSDAAATGTTASIITATGHSAAVGDWVMMTSGGEAKEMREVSAVAANTITLSSALSGTPSAAETFDIVRPVLVDDVDFHVSVVGWDSASIM